VRFGSWWVGRRCASSGGDDCHCGVDTGLLWAWGHRCRAVPTRFLRRDPTNRRGYGHRHHDRRQSPGQSTDRRVSSSPGTGAPGVYSAAVTIGIGLVPLVDAGSDRLETDTVGIVAAVLASARYARYTEAGSTAIGADADSTSTIGLLFGGGLLASPLRFVRDLAWLGKRRGLIVVAWLALVLLMHANVAFGWGLRMLAPTTVVMLTLLEPAVAALLAVTFLDERLSAVGWIKAGLVLAGMPLVALSARTTVRT